MKEKIPMVVRILLGLVFAAGGVFYFLGMAKPPPDLPPAITAFNTGLEASVYFMPFLKASETVCGLLLISGFFVPLALVILAPISLNIFLVHAFMMPQGLPLAVIIGLAMIYLAFFSKPYSPPIKALFRAKP